MANLHGSNFVAEDSQVASRVYNSGNSASLSQRIYRAVHRESFRNSAEIDREWPAKMNPAIFVDQDVAPAALRPDRDVKGSATFPGKSLRRAQHRKGRAMHRDLAPHRLAIEPAQLAQGIMAIHPPLHFGDGNEADRDRTSQNRLVRRARRNLHKRAQERACPARFNAKRSHTKQGSCALRRSGDAKKGSRR